nr:immunoglobulin light chain junction region [Macaca mulatta]
CQQYLDLLTF